jgi:hypothetical protein
MDKRDLTVVIPNHRGARELTEPLDSLSCQDTESFEVIILDDSRPSADRAILQREYPFISFVSTKEGKRTLPLRQRLNNCKGGCLLVVNPGVRLQHDALSVVSRAFGEDPSVHMISFKVFDEYKDDTLYEIGFLIATDGGLVRLGHGWRDTGEADLFFPLVFAPSASAWAFRKSLLQMAGGFSRGFYSFFDALELSIRGWKAGFYCRLVPDARAWCRVPLPLWEGFREPGMFLKSLERKFQTYFPESFIKTHGRTLHRTFRRQYSEMVGGAHAGLFPELKGLSFLLKSLVPEREPEEGWIKLSQEDIDRLLVDAEELMHLTASLEVWKKEK